jgi:hypothetical protein
MDWMVDGDAHLVAELDEGLGESEGERAQTSAEAVSVQGLSVCCVARFSRLRCPF